MCRSTIAFLLLLTPALVLAEPAIHVPDGYMVELAAGSPLVKHPMMAGFDDRGRLFVAESAGLNLRRPDLEKELPNFIRLLEDLDGDGRFDRSTIFADKLTLPMGALWHDGALYVAAPPNIWRFEDTDDDGVADRREAIVDQFGYSGNAASVHGCFLGPDGRIYWCDGRHGHEFRDDDGNLVSEKKGSYIFSCRPDGSDVQIHCGGGMDNPVEIDFTESGEMLGTVNIMYSRPRIDCLVHWLYGGTYPHSQRVLGEFKRTGGLLGPVHRFGHVAVSGTTRYRSGRLDPTFRDDFFVTIFNTGKVQRVKLARAGSTFTATEHEFLSSPDRDFHPTDVLEDADGSLLVVDTGGWFRIGCPTSQIARPEIHGAIYRVRRRHAAAVEDPRGNRIAWADSAPRALTKLLDDDRFEVRRRAIAWFARRGRDAVAALTAALQNGNVRTRRNAIWALTRIDSPEARFAVRATLHDPDETIRQAACHSVATTRDRFSSSQLRACLADTSPAVRRRAAVALGRTRDASAVAAILQAAAHAVDRSEEHSLIYALMEIAEPKATRTGLASAHAKTKRAALIAMDQMDGATLDSADVLPLLGSKDAELRSAATDIFSRRPAWAQAARDVLAAWLHDGVNLNGKADPLTSGPLTSGPLTSGPLTSADRAAAFRQLASALANQPEIAGFLGRVLSDTATTVQARRLVLGSIAAADAPKLDSSWIAPLRSLLATGGQDDVDVVLSVIGATQAGNFDAELVSIGQSDRYAKFVRARALEIVSRRTKELAGTAFRLLCEVVRSSSVVDGARAARVLGSVRLTKAQLLELADLLTTSGPLALRDLIRPYAGQSDAEVAATFLASLERSRAFLSLPTNEFSDVIKRFPEAALPAANGLLDRLKQQDEQRVSRLAELESLLAAGDAERGRELFFAKKSKCSDCHRVGKVGGRIGPDLSAIGRIRRGRDLLEAIVFPSASFAREYEPYSIVTDDGRVLAGLIQAESAQSIHLQQATGEPLPIRRDRIERIVPSTVSIMPRGLDQALTEKELADLVVWLQSQR